jgi:hypothetical protein
MISIVSFLLLGDRRNKLNRQTSLSRLRGVNRILLEGIRGVISRSSRNDYAHWREH